MIIKDNALTAEAKRIFDGTGIKISLEGERHLGAVLGSDAFRKSYVENKINKWVKDVKQLSEIGKEEPQVALSGYTKGLCHRPEPSLYEKNEKDKIAQIRRTSQGM